MSNRKLAFVVILLCAGVFASVAWYLAGEWGAAEERTEAHTRSVPTSMALPPGTIWSDRGVLAELPTVPAKRS